MFLTTRYISCARQLQNFEHINLVFVIGETTVPMNQVAITDHQLNRMDNYCREYYVLITQWPRGRHQLEIKVNFDQDINDGLKTYTSGTHFYKFVVTVKQ